LVFLFSCGPFTKLSLRPLIYSNISYHNFLFVFTFGCFFGLIRKKHIFWNLLCSLHFLLGFTCCCHITLEGRDVIYKKPLDQEGATYGPRVISGPRRLHIELWKCTFDLNLARETQIKAQCGPRKKIVARPCLRFNCIKLKSF